jgi:glycosyltransferase involved in cell wall biosynthesis
MPASAIQLSICIATFNRAAFIGETLESIISQATDEVEIVIVDGASSDNTEQVVLEFRQRFPALRYFRQGMNMGVDRDFNRAVELAAGEYCWLFPDDDLLKPGAIHTVLSESCQGYEAIIINAEVRNSDFSSLIEKRRLRINENRVYGPDRAEDFFVDTASYLSFIGGVVIKRNSWMARERERFFGTLFIHVGVIFQQPFPGDILVIAEPLISIRYGNAMWTSRSFEIWMFKWPGLIWSFADISESAKSRVTPRYPWKIPGVLMEYRARNAYSLNEYRKWVRPKRESFWQDMSAMMVAATPGWVANAAIIANVRIRNWDAPLLLADARNSPFYYRSCLHRLFRRNRKAKEQSKRP